MLYPRIGIKKTKFNRSKNPLNSSQFTLNSLACLTGQPQPGLSVLDEIGIKEGKHISAQKACLSAQQSGPVFNSAESTYLGGEYQGIKASLWIDKQYLVKRRSGRLNWKQWVILPIVSNSSWVLNRKANRLK